MIFTLNSWVQNLNGLECPDSHWFSYNSTAKWKHHGFNATCVDVQHCTSVKLLHSNIAVFKNLEYFGKLPVINSTRAELLTAPLVKLRFSVVQLSHNDRIHDRFGSLHSFFWPASYILMSVSLWVCLFHQAGRQVYSMTGEAQRVKLDNFTDFVVTVKKFETTIKCHTPTFAPLH